MSQLMKIKNAQAFDGIEALFRDREPYADTVPMRADSETTRQSAAASEPDLSDLFADVAEGNPFTHYPAINAQRPLSKAPISTRIVHDGKDGLDGFLAYHAHQWLGTAQALTSPYAPVSVPPVRQGYEVATLNALFDGLCEDGFAALRLSTPKHGAFYDALNAVVSARGAEVTTLRSWSRAGLYFDHADALNQTGISSKKRKELRRLKRRLSEKGAVQIKTYGQATLKEGAERFLDLEQRGWKGPRGTAMAMSNTSRALFESFVLDCPKPISCVIHSLELDHKPISMFVTFIQNKQAYLWKTCFDQTYSRFSPSGMLLLDMVPALHDMGVQIIDSCSSNQTSMADHYLPHRVEMADLLISTRRGQPGGFRYRAAATYLSAHEAVRSKAKKHILPLIKHR